MYWESALSSTAQVGIGLAGFSGVVAALRSGRDSWSESDQLNLQVLLGASGWSILFSLIPLALLDVLPSRISWNILSCIYFVVFVGISVFRIIQYRRGGISKGLMRRVLIGTTPIAILLLANGVFVGAAWPYVVVAISQLVSAFLAFVRLLRVSGDGAA